MTARGRQRRDVVRAAKALLEVMETDDAATRTAIDAAGGITPETSGTMGDEGYVNIVRPDQGS